MRTVLTTVAAATLILLLAPAAWAEEGSTFPVAGELETRPVPTVAGAVWVESESDGTLHVRLGAPSQLVRDLLVLAPSGGARRVRVEGLAGDGQHVVIAAQDVGPSRRLGREEDLFLNRIVLIDVQGGEQRELVRCVPKARSAPAFLPTDIAAGDGAVGYQVPECERDGLGVVTVRGVGADDTPRQPLPPDRPFGLRDVAGDLVAVQTADGDILVVEWRTGRERYRVEAGRVDNGALGFDLQTDGRGWFTRRQRGRAQLFSVSPTGVTKPFDVRLPSAPTFSASRDRALLEGKASDLRVIGLDGRQRLLSRVRETAGGLFGDTAAWAGATCDGVIIRLSSVTSGRTDRRTRCPLRLTEPARVSRSGVVRAGFRCSGYAVSFGCRGSVRLELTHAGRRVTVARGLTRRSLEERESSFALRLNRTGRRLLATRRRMRARLTVRTRAIDDTIETRRTTFTLTRR